MLLQQIRLRERTGIFALKYSERKVDGFQSGLAKILKFLHSHFGHGCLLGFEGSGGLRYIFRVIRDSLYIRCRKEKLGQPVCVIRGIFIRTQRDQSFLNLICQNIDCLFNLSYRFRQTVILGEKEAYRGIQTFSRQTTHSEELKLCLLDGKRGGQSSGLDKISQFPVLYGTAFIRPERNHFLG